MARDNNTNLVVWLLAGLAIGGLGAVLMAPAAGSRTRKRLLASADEGGKSLLETGQELFTKGRDLFEQGREIADDLAKAFEKSRAIAEKKIEDRF